MSRLKFLNSIRAKSAILFFLVFIAIILPVNYIIYKKVSKTLIAADNKELMAEADKLLNQTRLDPQTIPLPPLGYNLKIQLNQDFNFQPVFSSPEFPELDQGAFFQDVLEIDTLKIVTLHKRVEYSSAQLFFSLARSNTQLQRQLSDLKNYLFLANGAAIFLAGILVFIVTGFTMRPIQRIVTVAQRINASNSIERVPVPKAFDETRKLAETINAMLSRMETSGKDQINFFASAAHELKTPLTIMQTELTLARNQASDRETKTILENSLAEVQRLDRVIHDFLLISQLKSESLILRKRISRIDEVIYAALKKIKYLALERNIQIKVNIEELAGERTSAFDFDKMETVVANLLENAIRYASGALATITLKESNQFFEVTVTNQTKEMSSSVNELKNEFKKSQHESVGLGMGLWICEKIVKLHDGELELRHEGFEFKATVKLI